MNTHEEGVRTTPPRRHYDIERAGQIDFFDNYHINYQGDASILVDNTDGVYHGNIMEFKLNISNTGKVLFQAIKYLSKMRIKGESIPARILLIDLNATKVYVYNSIDYIDDIQQVYVGAASKDNDAFARNITPIAEYDYVDMVDSAEVQKLLINKVANETDWYIPIDLDENCIVGWAERYYREIPKATKGDFLGDGTGKINLKGEIREPKHFAGLINPYPEKTNEKFKYLMDCLNDRLSKRDLGAYFTPKIYCQKSAELVEMAVARVPDGNDYIILDRCAGTGNLESALYGRYDKNGDELISHCVVSTYEYYEYKVLLERIGQDVRNIIPPTETNVVYENGKISNADAMSKDYIDNPLIKQYVDNPKCTIILFENPPFTESNGTTKTEGNWKKSWSVSEMKKDVSGVVTNDSTNVFIWSGFKYYLRQDTDSYVLFSPIKYWKAQNLVNKAFRSGFLFNRKHFHATAATALACILWENKSDFTNNEIKLDAYDIDDNKKAILVKQNFVVKKVQTKLSSLYDRNTYVGDTFDGIAAELDGSECTNKKKIRVKTKYNDNIICYIVANMSGFENPRLNSGLVRVGRYDSNGAFVRRESYLEKLPLFVAKKYSIEDSWIENGTIYTSADKGDIFKNDTNFLKSCLMYTCLSYYNKCLSFDGSDGRYYRNELCFDTTNGDTVASADLAKMTLDADEKALMKLWKDILAEAKKTANYDSRLTYGVYQITKELNTSHEEGTGISKKTVYDYPNLNSYLVSLRDNLKAYYKSHITDKMFKYELLK